jgi:hypothetical protein
MPQTNNVANQLAVLLSEWTVPENQLPETVRGFDGLTDLDAWRAHTQAADLIRTIDSTLQGMDASGEDVEMFLRALPRWYAGVHFASTPWGNRSNSIRDACDERDVDLLRALGQLIKAGSAIEITTDEQRTLSDVLAQARSLIEEDATAMTPDIRHYLLGLVIKAQLIVDNIQDYGPEAVRQVALELGGALVGHAHQQAKTGNKTKARAWLAAGLLLVGGNFTRGATNEVATQAVHGTEQILKQITEG